VTYPISNNSPREPVRKAVPKRVQYSFDIPIIIIILNVLFGSPFLYTANFLNCDTIKPLADKLGVDYSHVDFTNCQSEYQGFQLKVDLIIFGLYGLAIGLIIFLKREERKHNR